jgi:hypothetical protein
MRVGRVARAAPRRADARRGPLRQDPLTARPGAVNCFIGVAVTRRRDSVRRVTRSRAALGCLPR